MTAMSSNGGQQGQPHGGLQLLTHRATKCQQHEGHPAHPEDGGGEMEKENEAGHGVTFVLEAVRDCAVQRKTP